MAIVLLLPAGFFSLEIFEPGKSHCEVKLSAWKQFLTYFCRWILCILAACFFENQLEIHNQYSTSRKKICFWSLKKLPLLQQNLWTRPYWDVSRATELRIQWDPHVCLRFNFHIFLVCVWLYQFVGRMLWLSLYVLLDL